MKRLGGLILVAIVAMSCAEHPADPGAPSFAVSDGANGGNPHFYFLPPLVPKPMHDGVFDPDVAAAVEVCELDGDVCGDVIASFGPDDVTVSTDDEQYLVNWKTGPAAGVITGQRYRIRVLVGSTQLGFRDTEAGAPRGRDQGGLGAAFFPFQNGRTIPITFRIEEGALCEGVDFDEERGACAVGNLEDGIIVQTDDGTGVEIPPQETQSGTVTVVVEPCRDEDGNLADLSVDLPLFGPCFEVRVDPELTEPLLPLATVFICEDLMIDDHRVEDLVTLHKSEVLDDSEPVFVLPNAPDLCPTDVGLREGAPVFARLVHTVRRGLTSVFGPRQLYAGAMLDRGAGGLSPGFSFFQFALPAKMDILEGDDQVAPAGAEVPVDPAVRVTDADDSTVAGATVHFEVLDGNGAVVPMSVVTGADGIARVTSWTLGDAGTNTLRAFGRGIADPVTNGPAPGFDPFVPVKEPDPFDEVPAELATGELLFTAEACAATGSIVVDGVVDAGWECAGFDATFTVEVDGVERTARFRLLNDGDNLYGLFTADGALPTDIVSLFVEFDGDGDGVRDAGDDMVWAKWSADGFGGFFDLFIPPWCAGSTATLCFAFDQNQDGTVDGAEAVVLGEGVWGMEWSHPLQSGDIRDFQLAPGDLVGFFLTVFPESTGETDSWPGVLNPAFYQVR